MFSTTFAITYFYGWWIVLETLGPWCLYDKKLVVPREKLERQRLKMLFFSPLMTTVEIQKPYILNHWNGPEDVEGSKTADKPFVRVRKALHQIVWETSSFPKMTPAVPSRWCCLRRESEVFCLLIGVSQIL
ncbi:hypothetical protein GEV33_004372 [Tenebrio molitor]|uniref:Uncharacterized protein n=1 Tax=Tenebrio molitor TaxID=7067 RepID=A0A8J6HPL2_TENMO|nr:hypothetical protein GEV33_004372 [Tenebrio molitor]